MYIIQILTRMTALKEITRGFIQDNLKIIINVCQCLSQYTDGQHSTRIILKQDIEKEARFETGKCKEIHNSETQLEYAR